MNVKAFMIRAFYFMLGGVSMAVCIVAAVSRAFP